MTWKNNARQFGRIAKTLHWVIALLIMSVLLMGWLMEDISDRALRIEVYTLHKSTGLLILALVVCRIIWRLLDPPPPPDPRIPRHMQLAGSAAHWGLYALMTAMPLSGWMLNSAANWPLNWFGIEGWLVPNIVAPSRELRQLSYEAHEVLGYAITALIVLHIAAALYHHFVRKDSTLARMLPFVKEPKA